jgi:hypothetical protein
MTASFESRRYERRAWLGGGVSQSMLAMLSGVVNEASLLKSLWMSAQKAASLPSYDPCFGNGPAWLAQSLAAISSYACLLAVNASGVANTVSEACNGVGADHAANARAAESQACTMGSQCTGNEFGNPTGTIYVTGENSQSCLDPAYYQCVSAQVTAALKAVSEATNVVTACTAAARASTQQPAPAPRVKIKPLPPPPCPRGQFRQHTGGPCLSIKPLGAGALPSCRLVSAIIPSATAARYERRHEEHIAKIAGLGAISGQDSVLGMFGLRRQR